PAQFRSYNLTEQDVQAFCARVSLPDPLLLFVEESEGVPHIVIGVVGPDNYCAERDCEIVYGRRWRVERHLSYSELLQTVLLACKTAVEHELRERLSVGGTTPLNAHQDHELMADLLNAGIQLPGEDVVLRAIAINGNPINIEACHAVDGVGRVLCMDLGSGDPSLPFIAGSLKAMVLNDDQPIAAVWDALLRRSHRWLCEGLLLDGQPVFSPALTVGQRMAFSKLHRNDGRLGATEVAIQGRFRMNHDIDTVRAPVLQKGPCNTPSLERLNTMNPEHGVWPHIVR
ncbi:MAG: hypothetical protein VX518_00360, partial [Candidatus Thermoplasmatota archaeon]|nr:hypothetical protein [Candidatus Thermoplasmatota archaeon]